MSCMICQGTPEQCVYCIQDRNRTREIARLHDTCKTHEREIAHLRSEVSRLADIAIENGEMAGNFEMQLLAMRVRVDERDQIIRLYMQECDERHKVCTGECPCSICADARKLLGDQE